MDSNGKTLIDMLNMMNESELKLIVQCCKRPAIEPLLTLREQCSELVQNASPELAEKIKEVYQQRVCPSLGLTVCQTDTLDVNLVDAASGVEIPGSVQGILLEGEANQSSAMPPTNPSLSTIPPRPEAGSTSDTREDSTEPVAGTSKSFYGNGNTARNTISVKEIDDLSMDFNRCVAIESDSSEDELYFDSYVANMLLASGFVERGLEEPASARMNESVRKASDSSRLNWSGLSSNNVDFERSSDASLELFGSELDSTHVENGDEIDKEMENDEEEVLESSEVEEVEDDNSAGEEVDEDVMEEKEENDVSEEEGEEEDGAMEEEGEDNGVENNGVLDEGVVDSDTEESLEENLEDSVNAGNDPGERIILQHAEILPGTVKFGGVRNENERYYRLELAAGGYIFVEGKIFHGKEWTRHRLPFAKKCRGESNIFKSRSSLALRMIPEGEWKGRFKFDGVE